MVKKNFVSGKTIRFHEYNEPLNLTEEDKAKVRFFCNGSTDAELIIGERRFMRVDRGSVITIEWSKIDEPTKSYALMWDQYRPNVKVIELKEPL